MGGRNRQRATFEKRQRELARQERQADKRARRAAQGEGEEGESPVDVEELRPLDGPPPVEPWEPEGP
jgi:hypothetical protein